jgi:hypothetical protein
MLINALLFSKNLFLFFIASKIILQFYFLKQIDQYREVI